MDKCLSGIEEDDLHPSESSDLESSEYRVSHRCHQRRDGDINHGPAIRELRERHNEYIGLID